MAIDIRNAAGQRLVIALDQTLTIEQAAGWLADDELPGAFSYPIKFPIAPNEVFLQGGYRPDSAAPDMELIVVARLDGVLYRRCRLEYRIQDAEGDGFLKIDAGEAWDQLRKLSLQDVLTDPIGLGSNFVPLPTRMAEIARMKPNDFPFTFFPIRNELFWESELDNVKVPGYVNQPYVNAWGKLANGTYGFLTDSATMKGYPISPQFYLVWVLRQIYAAAGYSLAGDWIGSDEVQRLTIFNQTALAGSPLQPADLLTGHVAIGGQHVPSMSVGDFLKALRTRFGLIYTFDGDQQVGVIRRFVDVVRTPPKDLTPYLVGKWGIDAAKNKGVSLIDAVDRSDELFKNSSGDLIEPTPLLVGSASSDRQRVELAVGTTQLAYEPSPMPTSPVTPGYWSVPVVRQAGNTLDPEYKASERYPDAPKPGEALKFKNEVTLRLLTYRGVVAASNSNVYPLGTPDVRNGKQEIVGTSALSLTGRYGLFRQNLRQFYYFRDQTRQLTVNLDMPVAVVAGLQLHAPISLKLDGQARRSYLIDKLQAESPGLSGLMECKLTCLTLPDGIDQASDVDEPVVWVELLRADVRNPGGFTGARPEDARLYTTLTVKCWANPARTVPVVAASLPLRLRVKKYPGTAINGVPVAPAATNERVDTYYISGAVMIIEQHYLLETGYNNQGQLDTWTLLLNIDPSDDYNILT